MNHTLSTFGYVALFFGVNFILVMASNVVIGLSMTMDFRLPTKWLAALRAGFVVLASYLMTRRFFSIERRRPTPAERDKLLIICFLAIAIPAMLVLALHFLGTMQPDQGKAFMSHMMMRGAAIVGSASCAAAFLSLYLFLGPLSGIIGGSDIDEQTGERAHI